MPYAEAEGGRRLYYEHYAGSGRAVVLVHGWGMSVRCWDTTLPALLASGHEVLAFDQRGCGHSDKDFDDLSVEAIAGDTVALVEQAGLERPVLNGWSFGGAVVVAAAAKLGDRLGGLVLTCGATPRYTSAPDWPYGGTEADVEGVLAALRENRAGTFQGVAAAVCHADVGQATVDWMWQIFLETGPRADESLRDLGRIDQRALLAGLSAPALVFGGAHDAFVPVEAVRACAELLPGARYVEFEGSGHAPFLEEGERYRSELLSFLEGVG